jgi:hypothetical protein
MGIFLPLAFGGGHAIYSCWKGHGKLPTDSPRVIYNWYSSATVLQRAIRSTPETKVARIATKPEADTPILKNIASAVIQPHHGGSTY